MCLLIAYIALSLDEPMSIFSICTAYVQEGKLDETIEKLTSTEKHFTQEIGVLSRNFFQCSIQPHIIWATTEWESEEHHHDAAQFLMKTRRDDRFASIKFGPEPYFEIFCTENYDLKIGELTSDLDIIIVAHGLINTNSKELFQKLRKQRTEKVEKKLSWLRTYHNIYAPDEFVAFLGFNDEESFNRVRLVGDFLLEEYLFTGLRQILGMSLIASYNQFICKPLDIGGRKK
ncbi:MAG: antibiotic biosynthesis monooxygenase [Candidatus Thorarchaeota archaeon]